MKEMRERRNSRIIFIKETGLLLERLQLAIKLRPVFDREELKSVRVLVSGKERAVIPIGLRSELSILKDIAAAL